MKVQLMEGSHVVGPMMVILGDIEIELPIRIHET